MSINSHPPPVPVTSPLLTSASVDMAQAGQDFGLITTPWMMFFIWLWQQITGGGSGSGSVVEEDYPTLTADTTITPTTTLLAGRLLFLFITFDATGGWQITWDASVKNAQTNLWNLANTYSVVQLIGRVDPSDSTLKWFACAAPLTGQPI